MEYLKVTCITLRYTWLTCLLKFAGLGRLEQAEEYLSQAQWTVLKTPTCSNAIKSRLYRNLGLLYAAKTEYAEALRQLADDVRECPQNNDYIFSAAFLL